jgi:hypothetical protein
MDSTLDEMKGEYEFIVAEKERKNAVQFQGKVLTTIITGLEFFNSKSSNSGLRPSKRGLKTRSANKKELIIYPGPQQYEI